MLDRFNFMAVEVNTFEDFDYEVEYQSPLFSFKNDNQEVGLSFVFKSLTDNQRKIIELIAKHQLENPQDKGISMKELLNLCIEQTVAYSQKGLRDYLHEAFDHKIVNERMDERAQTIVFMNYPTVLLEKIAN